ncbi:ABATE domain-containing protein [Streptomyces sp. NPDC102395]|uniref:ABATE domain-containing protein n=1 Tax=Streptomyces sp. NPDC102395 TaxID=3366168 RepID=UPI003816BFEC
MLRGAARARRPRGSGRPQPAPGGAGTGRPHGGAGRRAQEARHVLLTAARPHGRPLEPRHVDVPDRAADEPPPVSRLTPDGTRVRAPGATGTALLSTVARDAIDLFAGPHADRIRACGVDDCHLLFVDTPEGSGHACASRGSCTGAS